MRHPTKIPVDAPECLPRTDGRRLAQGRMGLPAWRDRIEDGEREIEEAGGKLVGVWVTLGRYDVVEVFEAPDDDTALEIVTKLSHHGAEQTETLRAFTRDEGVQRAGLAVHAHAPRLDQLVGPAPRGDPGPREVGIQAHDR